MSDSLRSQLDGPKWAPVNDGKRLRSESHPPTLTSAPRKPTARAPSAASRSRIIESSKKLFPTREELSDTADTSSRNSSFVEDPDSTPRAVQPDGDSSFFGDFLPAYPPQNLVNDIVGVASIVAGAAKVVTSNLLSDGVIVPPGSSSERRSPLPPSVSPITPPVLPNVPVITTLPVLPDVPVVTMANRTVLPHSKYLKTEVVEKFDGSPSELDAFDSSVKQMLLKNNLPLYYGGCVRGDPEDEYEYVSALEADNKSNYVLGKRLCAGLAARFEKAALRWWQDYDGNSDNPRPNCWRKQSDNPNRVADSVPAGFVEVALYDLLKKHFNSDMDAREAELELERFRWKPFGDSKDAMTVTVFRGHVERLMKRAGLTTTFPRIRAIRNCLPPKFRDRIEMESTEDKLWELIHKSYVTMEIDYVDKHCTQCGKSGHTADSCRQPRNAAVPTPSNQDVPVCTHCHRTGHFERTCWAKYGRPPNSNVMTSSNVAAASNTSNGAARGTTSSAQSAVPNSNPVQPSANPQNSFVRFRRTCFRCGKDDHLIKDCPQQPQQQQSVAASYVDSSGTPSSLYAIPQVLPHNGARVQFDDREIVLDEGGDPVALPLHLALSQSYAEREVFEVDRPPVTSDHRPSGCLWSLSSTLLGQHLLTVWDTGAVVAVVPKSTILQTGTDWIESSDVDFVMADGLRHTPLGHAPKFVFRIGTLYFVLKVYVVAAANYQLLLGTGFMHEVGAGLFPRWQTIILTSPVKISISGSTDAIQRDTCPSLNDEASAARVEVHRLEEDAFQRSERLLPPRVTDQPGIPSTDDRIVELADPIEYSDGPTAAEPIRVMYIGSTSIGSNVPSLAMNTSVNSTYRLGMKDLVAAVDSPIVEPVDTSLPTLTPAFIMSSIEFSDDVPQPLRLAICQDIIDYSHVFSWNAFDLGEICDVPHRVIRLDPSPAIQRSRPHLYTPVNDLILHAKCDPYIQLGIFTPAPPECKDRTQVTIVRTAKEVPDRHDPQFCRIAHDFRVLNDKIQLDPEPVDSVVDMLAWMGDSPTGWFFKTDADRGFYQIVCSQDTESINSTCFELFHRLWVSSRMLFGQKNGPATFKRNAIIMQGELLSEKKTKSYFDDIIGKADNLESLRSIWLRLLQLASDHGWKFKPTKTKWGFSKIETVGFEWSSSGIGVGKKNRDAVSALRFPTNKSELRGLLGLANQFRERVAGYAMLVSALTAMTRGHGKSIVATPEAIIEFENLKALLSSPIVLQQFRYGRPTFVYTDASVGTQDLPGGLGVVIVQSDEESGKDYVCAYASSGLTPAQKNYHIVRLELLAFVYACGKFYDWLAGIQFVWRSDCRAHEFLHQAKLSHNPTIARYALTLAEFDYRVEWVPGLAMIADPFSRMVMLPAKDAVEEAVTLPEIVFGRVLGGRIAASRKDSAYPPLLFFQPCEKLCIAMPCDVVVEDDDSALQMSKLASFVEVPVPSAEDWRSVPRCLSLLYDEPVPGMGHKTAINATTAPSLEELDVWPKLSRIESQRLEAIRFLRQWIRSKELAGYNEWMRPVLKDMGKRVFIEGDVLWKRVPAGRLEILDSPERLREVLTACHEGLGHRQLRSAYRHFASRYWVPGAAKLLKRHILSCKICQSFAKASRFQSPGFSPQADDVFTHWSIDFAGPFPKDSASGMEYVVIAVEWVTKWVEAEATPDASPETAADFLYTRVICRYGCFASLQSDNGPHFVNPILRYLTKLLKVRHHFSTPYYPQSNGRVERVIGTLKSMLRRTVAAATTVFPAGNANDDIQVVGVDLSLDQTLLNAIVSARDHQATSELDEEDIVNHGQNVPWVPLLHTVLWVYRATPHSTTGMSPALLALGRELELPFDKPPPAVPLTDQRHKELIVERLGWVTDAIPGLRELQIKDSTGTPQFYRYQLGQKVWKRESKYEGKGGFVPVFAPRWTGPFVIHSVYDKGAYKLRTIPSEGRKAGYLRNPVNGYRLKPFIEGEVME